MRKVVACLLACVMLLGSTTVFAAEEPVVYGMEGTYVVNIPDSLQLNAETQKGTGVFAVSNVNIPADSSLMIAIDGTNTEDNKWYMVSSTGARVEYTITSQYAGLIKPNEYYWVNADYINGKDMIDEVEFEIIDKLTPGAWSDKLTYVIWIGTIKQQCTFCATYFVSSELACTTCGVCRDCSADLKHCIDCDTCIAEFEEHILCTTCNKCVNPPDFCQEHQKCIKCDTCEIKFKDI